MICINLKRLPNGMLPAKFGRNLSQKKVENVQSLVIMRTPPIPDPQHDHLLTDFFSCTNFVVLALKTLTSKCVSNATAGS